MTLDKAVDKALDPIPQFLTRQATGMATDKTLYQAIGNEVYVFVILALDQVIEQATVCATYRIISDHIYQATKNDPR